MNTMLAATLWVALGGVAMPTVNEYLPAMAAIGIVRTEAECTKGCKGDFPASSNRRYAARDGVAGRREGSGGDRSMLAGEVDRSDLACLVSGKCPPTILVGADHCGLARCSSAIPA